MRSTAPPFFDGGPDATYPAACMAIYECPTQGCTCAVPPEGGFYWGCTLK